MIEIPILPTFTKETYLMAVFSAVHTTDETTNAAAEALGPTAMDASQAVSYTFNITNNATTNASVSYDLSCLLGTGLGSENDATVSLTGGNITGSLNPGESASVSLLSYIGPRSNDNDVGCALIQYGNAPLITVNGQAIGFWFYTDGTVTSNQQLDIVSPSGPYNKIAKNTSTECQLTDPAANLGIGLGGGDGNCTTTNICIGVYVP